MRNPLQTAYSNKIVELGKHFSIEHIVAETCGNLWGLTPQQTTALSDLLSETYRTPNIFHNPRAYVPHIHQSRGIIIFHSNEDNQTLVDPPNIPTPAFEVEKDVWYIPGQDAAYQIDSKWKEQEIKEWYQRQKIPLSNIILGSARDYLQSLIFSSIRAPSYHEHRVEAHNLTTGVKPSYFYVSPTIRDDYFPTKHFETLIEPNEPLIIALKKAQDGLLLTSKTNGVGKTHMLIAAATHRYTSMLEAQVHVIKPIIAKYIQPFEELLKAQQQPIASLLREYRKENAKQNSTTKELKKIKKLQEIQQKFVEMATATFTQDTPYGQIKGTIQTEIEQACNAYPPQRIALIHFKDLINQNRTIDTEARKLILQTRDLYIDELPIIDHSLSPQDQRTLLALYQEIIYTRTGEGNHPILPFTATANYTFEEIFSAIEPGERNRLVSRLAHSVCLEVQVRGEDFRKRAGNDRLRALGLA